MRLTLRTLLAYIDKTLDAGDSVTLATKVNNSSFARSIVERIEIADDCLAEAISFRQFGGIDDPNRIGGYLDSVLDSAEVENIEMLFIESSQHLIEVAVVHRVLTLVLGKQAEVPNSLRERGYGLDPSRSFDDAVYNAIFSVMLSDTSAHPSSGSIASAEVRKVVPARQEDSGVWDAHKRFYHSASVSDFDEVNSSGNVRIERAVPHDFTDFNAKKSFYRMSLVGWALFFILILFLFLLFSGL
jgi:hypothetical protein